MRQLLVFYTLSVFLYSCKKTTVLNDLSRENLKGKVLSVKMFSLDSTGVDKKLIEERFYNPSGNLTETKTYDNNGSIRKSATYSYTDKEATVKENTSYNYSSYEKWKFDEKGNCIEKNMYDLEGKSLGRWVVFFDKKNKDTAAIYYLDGAIYRRWVYKYDDLGNQIEALAYMPEGYVLNSYTWKYNKEKDQIEQMSYDGKGNLYVNETFTSLFEYDTKGNWVREVRKYMRGDKKFITERLISYY